MSGVRVIRRRPPEPGDVFRSIRMGWNVIVVRTFEVVPGSDVGTVEYMYESGVLAQRGMQDFLTSYFPLLAPRDIVK